MPIGEQIPWEWFEDCFSELNYPDNGLLIQTMVSLLFKHARGLLGEQDHLHRGQLGEYEKDEQCFG